MNIAVIDNGGGNVASIVYALERLGVRACLTTEASRIAEASHVILPGVGAAADAMSRLRSAGLDQLLGALSQPVLGICLGMQLLHSHSEEGDVTCLGILPGRVRRLQIALPVPHMGWNRLCVDRDHPLLEGIGPQPYVYFVHSYAVSPDAYTLAHAEYGVNVSAAVSRGNFHGVQFHPERSASVGARILRNFLSLES